MSGTNGLSVIIITQNEEANIRDCLDSVLWTDEIIVVDSGSTDRTADICKQKGVRVHVHDWPGFGKQKNRALGYATKDWVLSLDADERVTPELRAEILGAMKAAKHNAFYLPRLSQFCGKFVRHSGWYPDYVLRLFKRGTGRFTDDLVHETVVLEGTPGKLASPLVHYSYRTADDVERKVEHYSTSAAQQMFQAGRRATWLDAPLRGGWAFLRTYLLRLGLLDGGTGLAVARMNARTTYLKYRKLRELTSGQPPFQRAA
jgi:glycosyltransferase involved in cell wall biosynthesis